MLASERYHQRMLFVDYECKRSNVILEPNHVIKILRKRSGPNYYYLITLNQYWFLLITANIHDQHSKTGHDEPVVRILKEIE